MDQGVKTLIRCTAIKLCIIDPDIVNKQTFVRNSFISSSTKISLFSLFLVSEKNMDCTCLLFTPIIDVDKIM